MKLRCSQLLVITLFLLVSNSSTAGQSDVEGATVQKAGEHGQVSHNHHKVKLFKADEVLKQHAKNQSPLPHNHGEEKNLPYVCPMHPQVQQTSEGNCPICGMHLIKKKLPLQYEEASSGIAKKTGSIMAGNHHHPTLPAIKLSSTSQKIMTVKTAVVSKRLLSSDIQAIGQVAYNDDTTLDFVPRAEGWIEKLHTSREGTRVKKGDRLLDFYSPEILAAQDGYILALKSNYSFSGERREFFDRVAREKLKLYGITDEAIDEMSKSGELKQTIPLRAPQDGIITVLDVDQGDRVALKDRFMVIADMSSVWVNASVFENQIALLNTRATVVVRSAAFPDKSWEGQIDYISAALDPKTNTLPVRLLVNTPNELLKPNMLVQVSIKNPASIKPFLVVPNDAIIPLERDHFRVIRLNNDEYYQPIDIKLGRRGSNFTEILSGLEEGDKVVTSGQFLLDSESNLQAGFNRLQHH